MWIQIALVVVTSAVFAEPYYDSYDDTYNDQAEDMKTEAVEESNFPRIRRLENSFTPIENLTMASEDIETLKGAIHEYLGRNQPEYVAPTSPTRTPKPDQNPKQDYTNITRTQKPGLEIHEYITPSTPIRTPISRQEHREYNASTSPTKTPISGQEHHEYNTSTIPTRTPISGQKQEHIVPSIVLPSQEMLERIATDPTRTPLSGQEFHKYLTVTRTLKTSETRGYIVVSTSPEPELSGQASVYVDYVIPTRIPFLHTPGSDPATRTRPRLQGQLVDYTYEFEPAKKPLRTQIATMQTMSTTYPNRTVFGQKFHQYMTLTTPSRSSKSGHGIPGYIVPRENSEALLRASYYPIASRLALRRPTRSRKSKKTKGTITTRNLCTDKSPYCRTMCFDKFNYRVSCAPTSSLRPMLDMPKVLGLLQELIKDYDTNLTERFNTSLRKRYRTCHPFKTTTVPTTTTTQTTLALYDYGVSNKTGAIIAKCFVCGLELEGIPQNAHCSDAFAGEFLPLTPVDASARGHLAEFRKYCKYMDMLPWYINGTDSRSIWGAWTGGCSVRWLDLSGVYTQRACRNRNHPATGFHFVSKRMAKLEYALGAVDNGCIISPMASLVPFSRGISLYARFHACVCTGSWCNRATTPQYSSLVIAPLVFTILL